MKAQLIVTLVILCLSLPNQRVNAQPYPGRLGVEVTRTGLFVDLLKQKYRFNKLLYKSDGTPDLAANGRQNVGSLTAREVDANGWPNKDFRYTFDNRPVAEFLQGGTIDDPEVYRIDYSGIYKGSFTGQAILRVYDGNFTITNPVYTAATNTTTFDLTVGPVGPGHSLIQLDFVDTKLTSTSPVNSGIRNFKLIRPGYAANTSKVFTDAYIAALKSANFSTLRFMGISEINGNITGEAFAPDNVNLQTWTKRIKTSYASQSRIAALGNLDALSYEYQIQLCNLVNKDLWLNIPIAVDADYITQLATLVKNNLNSNLNVYVEHSNEVWNTRSEFKQYLWNKNTAEKEVSAGANYDYDKISTTNQYYRDFWAGRRHAKRTRDIVLAFASVFGQGSINTRVRGVLAGHSADAAAGQFGNMLKYLKENYGDPKNYMYTIAGGAYYNEPGKDVSSVDEILTDMEADIVAKKTNRVKYITLAKDYGLIGGYSAYEGGPHWKNQNTVNIANRIRAIRDPRQADLLKKNLTEYFWDLGGNLAMHFGLANSYDRFGPFGLTDDVTRPDRNYLFSAARELVGPLPATSATITFENATVSEGTGAYQEAGYELFESNQTGYWILGPAQSYASKVYQSQIWGRYTTLRRVDGTAFSLTSLQYGVGRYNSAGDATIKGIKNDGSTVTATYSFSSKTLQTLNLNWTDLKRVEINYYGGANSAYGVIDNLVVVAGNPSARVGSLPLSGQAEAEQILYPNPATDRLTLHYRAAGKGMVQLSLSAASGQVLLAQPFAVAEGDNAIDLTLPGSAHSGLHLIRVREGQKVQTYKVIIRK
jgi:hypothetical protein